MAMESNFGNPALRVEITDILCDLLGIKKPGDVILAELLQEAILREAQVCAITNLSHATIRRRVAAGTFPPPLKLGDDRQGAASGWLASEVIEWMRSLRREEQMEPASRADDIAEAVHAEALRKIEERRRRNRDVLHRRKVEVRWKPPGAIAAEDANTPPK